MAVGGMPEPLCLTPIRRVKAAPHAAWLMLLPSIIAMEWFAPAEGGYITAHFARRAS